MIRVRQIGKILVRRRRLYDVEYLSSEGETWKQRTALPVLALEQHVGVSEAWSMIHAARDLWDRRASDWVEMET